MGREWIVVDSLMPCALLRCNRPLVEAIPAGLNAPRGDHGGRPGGTRWVFTQSGSFVQLALVDEGRKSVILDIAGYPPGERVKNQIGAREALPKQYGDAPQYTLVVAGGDTDIKPVPAIELEARIRRAHSLIWAGGRRDPLVALLLLVSSARG